MRRNSMKKAEIGLIGLGVMGQNLVLNMERNGYTVSVYNRTTKITENFIAGSAKEKEITGFYSLQDFINSLATPRKIMLMIKAGSPVDAVIKELLPYLDKGDVIIDGGNSFFEDTRRRNKRLEDQGLYYLGVGVSGGEEGALKGPSIMPGGSKEAWSLVERIFTDIAAKVENKSSCCAYLGPDGAGHFVKMVHNGIEYSDMQLICEAYYLLRELLGMSAAEIKEVFADWQKGKLDSYLVEITADILGKIDNDIDRPMVDLILDRSGQKGTGKWTAQQGLEIGVSIPSIT